MDGGARLPMPVDDSQVQKQVRSAPVQSARAAVEHAGSWLFKNYMYLSMQ